MKILKDLTKKIRSRGRMDAENRWRVIDLLAAECEKAWIHPGWEDTRQKGHEWLERLKYMMRRKIWRKCTMRKSAEGSAGFLHQFTKPQHGEEVHRF